MIPRDVGGASRYLGVDEHRVEALEAALALLPDEDSYSRALVARHARRGVDLSRTGRPRFELADDALAMAKRLDGPVAGRVGARRPPGVVLRSRVRRTAVARDRRAARHHRHRGPESPPIRLARLPQPRPRAAHAGRRRSRMPDRRCGRSQNRVSSFRGTSSRTTCCSRDGTCSAVSCWQPRAEIRTAYRHVRALGILSLGAATARQMLGVRFWQDRADTMLDAVAFGVTVNPTLRSHHAYWLLQAGQVHESATGVGRVGRRRPRGHARGRWHRRVLRGRSLRGVRGLRRARPVPHVLRPAVALRRAHRQSVCAGPADASLSRAARPTRWATTTEPSRTSTHRSIWRGEWVRR